MNWNSYFRMMRDWKKLPAYRAEPRIDSIVGFYLPDFASDYLNDKITGIIPELPLRLATLDEEKTGDKSYKVDFYLLGASGTHYLVEFKTDSSSRRDKQDEYLEQAKVKGMALIVDGILRIADVSTFKNKYEHLIIKLKNLELLDENRRYCGSNVLPEIVYVQPGFNTGKNNGDNVIAFDWIADWLKRNYQEGDFEKELGETLAEWAE
jgi:hypothetical protein